MLKKGMAVLLLACTLFSCALAQEKPLAQDILTDFENDPLFSQGYAVEDYFYPWSPYCFVLLRSPWNDLTLCMYEQWLEGWERNWDNRLFHSEEPARFADVSQTSFTLLTAEKIITCEKWAGDWYASQIYDRQTGMTAALNGESGRSPIRYTGDGLALIDFSGASRTAEHLQLNSLFYLDREYLLERFANVPAYSVEGIWQNNYVLLLEDIKFPVYSGPGAHYLRGANGKASVSGAEPFSVLGRTGGWLMVLYSVSDTQNRVGYIDAAQHWRLEEVAACVEEIAFENKTHIVTTRQNVPLYDDPIHAGKPLASLPFDHAVRLLAQDAVWCYVETEYQGEIIRGFIQTEDLSNG